MEMISHFEMCDTRVACVMHGVDRFKHFRDKSNTTIAEKHSEELFPLCVIDVEQILHNLWMWTWRNIKIMHFLVGKKWCALKLLWALFILLLLFRAVQTNSSVVKSYVDHKIFWKFIFWAVLSFSLKFYSFRCIF